MTSELPDVLPLAPYFREMVWGGHRLAEHYHKVLPAGKKIGESFELSAYPEWESRVAAGPLAGWDLNRLVQTFEADLVGDEIWQRDGAGFPLLIKLLDAQQDLSIQVHPDDSYAQAQKLGPRGKSEAWYILRSNGGRVAYGLEEGVGPAQLRAAVETGAVEEAVRFFEVQAGDVVYSPPGTVHALCQGVMIYEVQQSSDLTFRLYDYDRPGMDGKPRQLHIEDSLAVIDFERQQPAPVHWSDFPASDNGIVLADTEYFCLRRFAGSKRHSGHPSFQALTLVEGTARVGEYELAAGSTVLVPAEREIEVEGEECVYLVATAEGQQQL